MALETEKTGGLPPRILLYGVPKIGKSSFGAKADRPIFQQTEDGLDALEVNAFKKAEDFESVLKNLRDLAEQPHDYGTYVMDSADHLEPLIWQQVVDEDSEAKNIEQVAKGYGKGFTIALNLWRQYYDHCDYLRRSRRMTIINIAHAKVKRFESPMTDAYDRYEVKLQQHAAGLMVEQSDIILFANYIAGVRKEADNSRQKEEDKRKRGVGDGQRMLYAEERPAFIAGNRYGEYGFPAEILFDKESAGWSTIAKHVPFFSIEAAEDERIETAATVAKKGKKK